MTRSIVSVVVAFAALLVSLGYFFVLTDGYAQPTEIAGTLYRFAGSTGTVLLVATAFLVAFPIIVGTRMRRLAVAALIVGWVLIELGSMAFSLWYDYEHLGHDIHFWNDVQGFLFIPGYVLMVAGSALLLIQRRPRNAWWIAACISIAIVGIALFLLAAVSLRSVLFLIPVATIVTVILVPLIRQKSAARQRSTS
jgi:hypothetical protein